VAAFRHQRDPRLDRELKKVPLPEGLLARLKQIAAGPDAELDAALCEVPMAEDLPRRLKAVAREDGLDEKLRDVPVPAGLAGRLREISRYTDREIDAQLRDVRVSDRLPERLRATSRRRRRGAGAWTRSPLAAWAVAASLMLGAGLYYLLMTSGAPPAAPPRGTLAHDSPPPKQDRPAAPSRESDPTPAPSGRFFADSPAAVPEWTPETPPEAPLAAQAPLEPPPSAVARTEEAKPTLGVEPRGEAEPPARPLAAMPAVSDTLPELAMVEASPPRGVAPPRVKEFDWLSLLKDGVHPFVDPSARAELAVSRVPLVTRRTSYLRARSALEQGRLPDGSAIRVEEFLAAVDYDFPPPTGGVLGIRAAAGPSPFGAERGLSLLQVGVQAGPAPQAARPVTHLTLAIDVSASMSRGGRLSAARRAIAEFLPRLAGRDQLAIVLFSEGAEILINGAERDEAALVLSALETIRPRSSTNLGAGLQLASDVALKTPVDDRVARRLVVLTDGLGQVPQPVVERVRTLVADTARQGVRVEWIDLGSEDVRDEQLEELARAAGSQVHYADGAEAIRYALQEAFSGQSQIVARAARLTVKFNPETVERYRLLGHEADALGGLAGGALETDLRAGEAATALYELRLKPTGGDDVAEVVLAWRDPRTGVENRLAQRISRLQFATSTRESAVALQRAAVVAETAEILRGSKFAPAHPSGLDRVWEVAERLAPPARRDASFRQFLQVLEIARHLRGRK
jgi:Ca-activated chloride channel family protein